ncbi:23S rRNA (guanine(745)-N(1))-methyltransferase [Mariniblastus fucicola]|uniref:23S rRNA (Guanine(745)-N(1))-methyltransferase n=1 Tax=Mariniblastus fucicola TaxID=980251 RepID=A0A5B9PMS4_9BACT|nr:23S rRNA (guanine(745)-N(1))-methyltransferase [Mariniblastus fucicola]
MRCASGHNFDRAKEGYWNLTQPQDKKSSNPGDSDEAVLARRRWLERGLAAGLVESLREWTSTSSAAQNVLDLGCGEGSFGPALFPHAASSYCGIDLSRRAIKLAARGWPEATWVLANADRGLPIADGCIQQVVSLFGRRPVSEIERVLSVDGVCVVAIPGEEDLIELREQTQKSGHRRSRWEMVAEEMKAANLVLSQHKKWTQHVELKSDEIADALAMTYRAVRNSQQSRLKGVEQMNVTLAADLLLFCRGK